MWETAGTMIGGARTASCRSGGRRGNLKLGSAGLFLGAPGSALREARETREAVPISQSKDGETETSSGTETREADTTERALTGYIPKTSAAQEGQKHVLSFHGSWWLAVCTKRHPPALSGCQLLHPPTSAAAEAGSSRTAQAGGDLACPEGRQVEAGCKVMPSRLEVAVAETLRPPPKKALQSCSGDLGTWYNEDG